MSLVSGSWRTPTALPVEARFPPCCMLRSASMCTHMSAEQRACHGCCSAPALISLLLMHELIYGVYLLWRTQNQEPQAVYMTSMLLAIFHAMHAAPFCLVYSQHFLFHIWPSHFKREVYFFSIEGCSLLLYFCPKPSPAC